MMKRLQYERPARAVPSHVRNQAEAVLVLAQVARERHRLRQERDSLERRINRIEARLKDIAAAETRLVPMIQGETSGEPCPAAPPPRSVLMPERAMTLQY